MLMGPAPFALFRLLPQTLGTTWVGLTVAACGNAFAIVTSAALIARALQARGISAEQATNAIAALLQQTAGIGALCGNVLGGTLGANFGFRATTAGIGCAYLVLPLLFASAYSDEMLVLIGVGREEKSEQEVRTRSRCCPHQPPTPLIYLSPPPARHFAPLPTPSTPPAPPCPLPDAHQYTHLHNHLRSHMGYG